MAPSIFREKPVYAFMGGMKDNFGICFAVIYVTSLFREKAWK